MPPLTGKSPAAPVIAHSLMMSFWQTDAPDERTPAEIAAIDQLRAHLRNDVTRPHRAREIFSLLTGFNALYLLTRAREVGWTPSYWKIRTPPETPVHRYDPHAYALAESGLLALLNAGRTTQGCGAILEPLIPMEVWLDLPAASALLIEAAWLAILARSSRAEVA